MNSIIQHERQCLVCGSWNIKEHTIFNNLGEEYGINVWLCPTHKEHCKEGYQLDIELKQLGQKSFEYRYGTRKEFIDYFGMSYI